MTNFLNSIFMLERGFAILVYSFEWNETSKNKFSSTFLKTSKQIWICREKKVNEKQPTTEIP